MTVRPVLVALASLLLAVQVLRSAAVERLSAEQPAVAARLWAGHPEIEAAIASKELEKAGRSPRSIPAAAPSMIDDLALKAPLSPEPFLVRGVAAEARGDGAAAQRAFEAAQWRDPNSLAAADFLAGRYFLLGDVYRCLREAAAMVRLSSDGYAAVAPYLASYARNPADWAMMRAVFRANPALSRLALANFAGSPATAPAVLALADPREGADPAWLETLVDTLVTLGKYGEARLVWEQWSGVKPTGLIYDSEFRDGRTPPPFNWLLTSSPVGIAERRSGRLHVVFYGQEDGILASELLLLQPGQYRLTTRLFGDAVHARSLSLSIWCAKAEVPVSSVSVDVAAGRGWIFTIPSNCPAQSLKLAGASLAVPQQVDVGVGSLKLERLEANG